MVKKYKDPDKKDVIQYYITENHTKSEASAHFGLSLAALTHFLAKNGIKKMEGKSKYDAIPKDALIDYFITQSHTKKETAEFFGVSIDGLQMQLEKNGIRKTNEDIQKTILRQNKEKLSAQGFVRSEEAKEKTRGTCLSKYGVDNPAKAKSIKDKISEGGLKEMPPYEELKEYYLIQNHNQTETANHYEVSVSLLRKWLKKSGLEKTKSNVIEKRKDTCRKKYGTDSVFKSEHFRRMLTERHNITSSAQKHIQHKEIWNSKDKMKEFLLSFDHKPMIMEFMDFFGVSFSAADRHIHDMGLEEFVGIYSGRSSYEEEIIAFLHSLGIFNIKRNDRTALEGGEIDLYLPDYKFGIEFDGEYWHCDAQPRFQDHNGRSTRHQEKSLAAEKRGITLFHIFEHEWDPKFTEKNPIFEKARSNIKNRLSTILSKNDHSIGARECSIVELSSEEKENFLNENHVQGNEKHSIYHLGLKKDGQLLCCMSFGKSKFAKYDWELTRFCTLKGWNVAGGASKLLRYFIKNKAKSGNKIVSYSDITKTSGKLYMKLGFECTNIGDPNYWWVNLATYDVRSRYKEQAAGEVSRMHSKGYHRICDCGTKTWVYTVSD